MLLPILFVHALCLVTIIVTINIVLSSMLTDTVDENELLTGKRQEGLIMSALAFIAKATSGMGGFLAGVALDLIDFPRGADPTIVPSSKIFQLGLVVGPGLMGLYVLSLVFLSQYGITRARHAEILVALEQRRSEVAG